MKDEKDRSAFVSYAWSSQGHIDSVLRFAERLQSDGVKIRIDKWHLKRGHDTAAYMEQMVTDPNIDKVLCICDRAYEEKANARKGGAGIEAQIITPELYDKTKNEKFIPIVFERDPDTGKEFIPVFLKGRYYIDLSDPESENYEEQYEELIRAIYDRPLHRPPPLGTPPAHLFDDTVKPLVTLSKSRRVRDALESGRMPAKGPYADYLRAFLDVLRQTIVPKDARGDIDDLVYERINAFEPYREEFLNLFRTICEYSEGQTLLRMSRETLEKALGIIFDDGGYDGDGSSLHADSTMFVLRDLFVHVIALLIDTDRIADVDLFLDHQYTFYPNGDSRSQGYDVFSQYLRSLDEVRKNKLEQKLTSVVSKELKDRAGVAGISLNDQIQADIILGLRAAFHTRSSWFPFSIVWSGYGRVKLRLFGAVASPDRFDAIKQLLRIDSKEDLVRRLQQAQPRRLDRWGGRWDRVDINRLLNIEDMP